MHPPPHPAMLLLGPTGSGKTPLGDHLERHGWRGRRCAHFDFGAHLRRAAAGQAPEAGLEAAELDAVRRVLAGGALLEDAQFIIAARLLDAFLRGRALGAQDWLILNGLPRHAGQAAALEPLAQVRLVVELRCTADVVQRRIALNAGGDRAGRMDDSPAEVARKLALYAARTAPLLDHYRGKGVSVCAIPVTVDATSEDLARQITSREFSA